MNVTEFEWTQPFGKKTLRWKPLTVGKEMDVEAFYRQEGQRHLQKYALYMSRITQFDGKPGVDLGSFRDWDADDLVEFVKEVESKESARRFAMIKAKKDTGSYAFELEKAVSNVQDAIYNLTKSLNEAVLAAKSAEVHSGPLE